MIEKFNQIYLLLTEEHKKGLFWVIFSAGALGLFEALGVVAIFYFFSFISGVIPPQIESIFTLFNFTVSSDDIVLVGLVVLFVIVGKNGYSLWSLWFQNRYISYVRHSLSVRLLQSILGQEYSFFLNRNTEILRARFLTDVDRITDGFLRGFLAILSEGLVALCIFMVLLLQNFIGTLVIVVGLGFAGFVVHFGLRAFSIKSSHELTAAHHKRYFIGGTMMSGIKDLKANCSDTYFFRLFSEASELFSKVNVHQHMILVLPRLSLETFAFGALITGILLYPSGGAQFEELLPTLAIYGAAAYRLMPSINRILASLQQVNFAVEPIAGIHEMMRVTSANLEELSDSSSLILEEEILISNLSYSYPETEVLTIKDMSFSIKKNEFVGIVGSSGAGKSTLIDIMLGLLYPTKGDFLVDGKSIDKTNAKKWRSQIGYVPQSIFLLDDTVANNIVFGRDEEIDLHEVKRVCELAQIDEVISEMSDGFGTYIGENGVRLSGGQRQRIGIARALYGGAEVLLFDEATSALDNETERDVTKSILSLVGKITMIVVAHRLSTVADADKLLVLDRGELADSGKFDELMIKSATLRRISLANQDV